MDGSGNVNDLLTIAYGQKYVVYSPWEEKEVELSARDCICRIAKVIEPFVGVTGDEIPRQFVVQWPETLDIHTYDNSNKLYIDEDGKCPSHDFDYDKVKWDEAVWENAIEETFYEDDMDLFENVGECDVCRTFDVWEHITTPDEGSLECRTKDGRCDSLSICHDCQGDYSNRSITFKQHGKTSGDQTISQYQSDYDTCPSELTEFIDYCWDFDTNFVQKNLDRKFFVFSDFRDPAYSEYDWEYSVERVCKAAANIEDQRARSTYEYYFSTILHPELQKYKAPKDRYIKPKFKEIEDYRKRVNAQYWWTIKWLEKTERKIGHFFHSLTHRKDKNYWPFAFEWVYKLWYKWRKPKPLYPGSKGYYFGLHHYVSSYVRRCCDKIDQHQMKWNEQWQEAMPWLVDRRATWVLFEVEGYDYSWFLPVEEFNNMRTWVEEHCPEESKYLFNYQGNLRQYRTDNPDYFVKEEAVV